MLVMNAMESLESVRICDKLTNDIIGNYDMDNYRQVCYSSSHMHTCIRLIKIIYAIGLDGLAAWPELLKYF